MQKNLELIESEWNLNEGWWVGFHITDDELIES